jgi:predicted cytidylate kinase
MKTNKITISGYAGTGKSTVGKVLAEKLNYEFLSVGNFTREFAEREFGMSINEFQEKCEKEPSLDDYVNFKFRDICNNTENFVADFRLGFYFVKNSLNVLFTLSEKEAFERLSKTLRNKEQTDFESIRKRNEDMRRRFIEKFGVDFADEKNYDLIIDTSEKTPLEIMEQILAAARLGIETLRELNEYLIGKLWKGIRLGA